VRDDVAFLDSGNHFADVELLTKTGIVLLREPHPVSGNSWAASFRDPDGHILSILARISAAAENSLVFRSRTYRASWTVDSPAPSLHTLGMDSESARAFLLRLPLVEETLQWGNNLVFWVGDKAIGGKMFAVLNLDADSNGVLSFAAAPEGAAELLEIDGIFPAPYLARAHWVAMERWSALRASELETRLRGARDIIEAKLPRRTRDVLAMAPTERRKLIAARKKELAKRGKQR
jgi:predicted DNA-binding protein (MmcQ/YjbR family)